MQSRKVAVRTAMLLLAFALGCEKLSGLGDLELSDPVPGTGGSADGGAGTAGSTASGGSAGKAGTGGTAGKDGGAGTGGAAGDGGAGFAGTAGTAGSAGTGGSATDGGDADAPLADFTLSVPANQKAVRGASSPLPVSITRGPGFTGTVTVSISPPLPSGVTADSPQIADPATTANVNLSATGAATLGHSTIQVQAASGGLVHDQTLDLLVADPPGTLDETFNTVGFATVQLATASDTARGVAIQPDGKIVVAGTDSANHWALARFNADGSLDTGFGTQGKYVGTKTGELNGVAIQADGRIVAAGTSSTDNQLGLLRVLPAGTLDTLFGTNGVVLVDAAKTSQSTGKAVRIQSDKKIVAAGSSSQTAALFRFDSSGAMDGTFNGGITTGSGGTSSVFNALVIQTDGSIIGAGSKTTNSNPDIFVMRVNAAGAPDPALGGAAGKVFDINGPEYAYGVDLDPNGKIMVAGAGGGGMNEYIMLRLLSSDGTLDPSFDTDGRVSGNFAGCQESYFRAMLVQADGRLLGIGYGSAGSQNPWPGAVMRLLPSGAVDTGFGSSGLFTIKPGGSPPPKIHHFLYAAALMSDGRLVAVGNRSDGGWLVVRIWL